MHLHGVIKQFHLLGSLHYTDYYYNPQNVGVYIIQTKNVFISRWNIIISIFCDEPKTNPFNLILCDLIQVLNRLPYPAQIVLTCFQIHIQSYNLHHVLVWKKSLNFTCIIGMSIILGTVNCHEIIKHNVTGAGTFSSVSSKEGMYLHIWVCWKELHNLH